MKKLLALLALLAAFPPLSTDMYLAAIPMLVKQWQEPLAVVNLTLICFFITYCCFLLFFGPLADRYGRRPPLLVGLSLFILASFGCAAAQGVYSMIAARIVQGAGAAAASSIAFAICKDLFSGNIRQRIFIQIGIIVAAAPMIAPIIGGWIIENSSWRWIFILQAFLAAIAFISVWLMDESLSEPTTASIFRVCSSYCRLMRNREYFLLTLTLAVIGVPFFAYIAMSADTYISNFGYSERQYGYFFALNASAFIAAPLVFNRVARRYSLKGLLPLSYLGVAVSSSFLLISAIPMPYRLVLPMWFLTFFFSFGRPPGNNLILEQVDTDAGAASSFMVFSFFLTGACSMWLISLDWHDKILILGYFGVVSAILTLAGWLLLSRFYGIKYPKR